MGGPQPGVGEHLTAAAAQLRLAAADPLVRAPARPARGARDRGDAGMRRAAIVLIAWGALLAVMTAAQAPFGPHVIEYTMLGAASAASLITGAVLALIDAGRDVDATLLASDESVATATFATGLP